MDCPGGGDCMTKYKEENINQSNESKYLFLTTVQRTRRIRNISAGKGGR